MKKSNYSRIVVAAVLILSFGAVPGAWADQQVVNGVTWTYSVSGVEATITGASPLPGALVFPQNLGGYTGMIIKDYLFQTRSVLESVTISDGVAIIGRNAFNKCPNLKSVETGDGVKNVGQNAFFECGSLKSATIGNNVTNIGIWAFGYCTNLVSVEIGDNLRSVEGHGFGSCYRLPFLAFPNGLERIGSQAFSGCSRLKFLAVPASWEGTDKLNGTSVPSFTTVCYGVQKVTFNANGGTCTVPSRKFGVGATYANFGGLPEATKPGYRLAGWYTKINAGTSVTDDSTVPDTATRTLYAHWQKVQTVTFDPNGGTCDTETKIVDYGHVLDIYGELPVPTKPAGGFLGWFTAATGGTQVTADMAVTPVASRTLYAHWLEPKKVWRFYSPNYKGHFYTIDEAEKNDIEAHNPNWNPEGEAYRAFTEPVAGSVALHRFYSKKYKGHFFTINEAEKNDVEAHNPNWKYEGIAYYVYPEKTSDSFPVFRFWSARYRHHFYTMDAAEMESLREGNPNWAFEGVAFWTIPKEETTYADINDNSCPATSGGLTLSWTLAHGNIVAGSVEVYLEGKKIFVDDATGQLLPLDIPAFKGTVKYSTGGITVMFTASPGAGKHLSVSYRYITTPHVSNVSVAMPPAVLAVKVSGIVVASRGATTSASVSSATEPWTLVTWPEFDLVATDGETEIDGVVIEASTDAPDTAELDELGNEAFVNAIQLLLSLPDGLWHATLWNATDGTVADEYATGVFGFTLPANGAWHWLRVRDVGDEDAFSLWLKAKLGKQMK